LSSRGVKGYESNVVKFGLVSMLTDASTEMMSSVLPVLMFTLIKMSYWLAGIIEGLAEASSALFKYVSGALTDRVKSRKRLTMLGYTISNLSKPLMSLATSPSWVASIRIADRSGKGVREPPRDVIIVESVRKGLWGRAFGLHKMLDQSGAVLGPIIALALLSVVDLRLLLALTVVPGVAAIMLLFTIKEPPTAQASFGRSEVKGFKPFLASVGLLSLSSLSFVFVVARGMEVAGQAAYSSAILYVLIQVLHVAATIPAGEIADRVGRVASLAVAHGSLVASMVMLALPTSPLVTYPAIALYGFHRGFMLVSERTIIPYMVPEGFRGRAFGLYNAVMGLSSLAGNTVAGFLYSSLGAQAAFAYASITAFISMIPLAIIKRSGFK